MIRALLILAAVTCARQATAGEISGPGRAIDSTILQIGDQRIMLFGIDSIMRKQLCSLDGKPWQCWTAAVHDLQSLLDQGPAVCKQVDEPDIYGRVLARCTVNGQSISEQLVSRGFAVARRGETTDYVAAETVAKDKRCGLWQGRFVLPDEFRRSAGIAVERP